MNRVNDNIRIEPGERLGTGDRRHRIDPRASNMFVYTVCGLDNYPIRSSFRATVAMQPSIVNCSFCRNTPPGE